jgi:hypothetical protein
MVIRWRETTSDDKDHFLVFNGDTNVNQEHREATGFTNEGLNTLVIGFLESPKSAAKGEAGRNTTSLVNTFEFLPDNSGIIRINE